MYIFIGILIVVCILFFCINHYRKACIIKKVCTMSTETKCYLLCSLIEDFGFCYNLKQDIFTSQINAWQRDYGYCTLFDRTAPLFQMVFDCEPIYFDYNGKTWLIELWKGQYGINTGGEVGIYHADGLILPSNRTSTLFHAVSCEEMLPIHIDLCRNGKSLFKLTKRHWWLTGFCMGQYTKPEQLDMTVSITFPNQEMLYAFTDALFDLGYEKVDIGIYGEMVTIYFSTPKTKQPCQYKPVRCAISQWKNRLFCRIYNFVTRPFTQSMDKLLYLYYFLPFAFRKMVTIRKPRKHRRKRNEL